MILNKPYIMTEIKKTTKDVTTFSFKAQDGTSIDFLPGMFAMLTYTDAATGTKVSRAFSMANTSPATELQFFVSMIGGQLTSKLAAAKVGDVYTISAPYGQFKLDPDLNNKKLLFLAGGTGLAPFFSMLRFIIDRGAKPDVVIIYSVKYAYDIIEKEQLEQMMAKLGGKLVVTVTRPDPQVPWDGQTGRVDANMVSKYVNDVKDRVVYICGPPEFTKALKTAVVGLGANEKEIRAEMWG